MTSFNMKYSMTQYVRGEEDPTSGPQKSDDLHPGAPTNKRSNQLRSTSQLRGRSAGSNNNRGQYQQKQVWDTDGSSVCDTTVCSDQIGKDGQIAATRIFSDHPVGRTDPHQGSRSRSSDELVDGRSSASGANARPEGRGHPQGPDNQSQLPAVESAAFISAYSTRKFRPSSPSTDPSHGATSIGRIHNPQYPAQESAHVPSSRFHRQPLPQGRPHFGDAKTQGDGKAKKRELDLIEMRVDSDTRDLPNKEEPAAIKNPQSSSESNQQETLTARPRANVEKGSETVTTAEFKSTDGKRDVYEGKTAQIVDELDYDLEELDGMQYGQLATESFDCDPRRQINQHDFGPPGNTLEHQLQSLVRLDCLDKDTGSSQRESFFSSLPIDIYEECGDVIVDQFTQLLTKYKAARKKRREVAKEIEAEIAEREEAVRSRFNLTMGGLDKLRQSGEDLMNGGG